MVATEVTSPARPRSSSSARVTASSIASGERNASGKSSEAGLVIAKLSSGHRLRDSFSLAFREHLGRLARRDDRRQGAVGKRRLLVRMIGTEMRAAAFPAGPGRGRNEQGCGCHVAKRNVAGVALDRGEGTDGFCKCLALPDHADMRA